MLSNLKSFIAQQEQSKKARNKKAAPQGKKRKTWKRRGDLEAEKRAQREEKTRKAELKKRKELDALIPEEELEAMQRDQQAEEAADDGELMFSVADVQTRLRERNHPITLFGETDIQREARLRRVEEQTEEDRMGQSNMFNELMEELGMGEERVGLPPVLQNLVELVPEEPETLEDELAVFWLTIIKEWHAELEAKEDMERKTREGKIELARWKQTCIYMLPFFEKLKERDLSLDLLTFFDRIVSLMKKREYLEAFKVYTEMSIGNAPWPMGVTMVGIHARAGRERISEGQHAHVLNDEVQRKYITVTKRLMSWYQRVYPTDPSKCIG